jgi:chaperonin GroES
MSLNVRLIGDRFLVEPVEAKAEQGGIIIPDTARETPMESMVVAVGTGKTNEDGTKVLLDVKQGDRVLVTKYGGMEIKLDGREYRIFNGDDILAVIDN